MRLTEDEIRRLTLEAINELGDKASPDLVKKVVSAAIDKTGSEEISFEGEKSGDSGKIILTSFGVNQPGVVAAITKVLSDYACDIQDISQKIMGTFFTMIMIIDITNSPKSLREIQEAVSKTAEEMKFKIYIQHEEIFRQMHRI